MTEPLYMHRIARVTAAFIIMLLCLASCKKDPNPIVPAPVYYIDTPGIAVTIDHYPLVTGHQWSYSNGCIITAIADTTINGKSATQLLTNWTGRVYTREYFCNDNYGLKQLACAIDTGNSIGLPYGSSMFNCLTYTDSFRSFSPSLFLAQFPASTGYAWPSNELANVTRYWARYVTVTNNSGRFDCVKMEHQCANVVYYYYFSTKGLIRRVKLTYTGHPTDPVPEVLVADLVSVNF